MEVKRGPQTGGEVTYHIRVSQLPFERAAECEAGNDENDGEDELERVLDIQQPNLSVEEAHIFGRTDDTVISKRVPHRVHDDRKEEE